MKKRGWKMGTVSDDVRKLQDCMTADGVFKWKHGSTGYFGEVTKNAFVKWRNQGSSCQDLKNAGWIFGERNDQVVRLQNCMTDAGTFNWKYGSTGYFGEVTKQALIDWRGYF
jgi:peptidoglycan hydrolase-like protein with peptidoglycan-binding domain